MRGILVVSFGTTHRQTLDDNIKAVEDEIRGAFPDASFHRAFTSRIVRSVLERRGEHVDGVDEALHACSAEGVDELIVVVTHLLYGVEYDMLIADLASHVPDFASIRISAPLLANHLDYRRVLQALVESAGLDTDEALVLMGHGTTHFCNSTYAALEYEAQAMGFEQVFVGCVEGYPHLDDCLAQVVSAWYDKVLITPLMLVAGDHAVHDMAGQGDWTWESAFKREDMQTRCLIRGLGEIEQVRALYREHALAAAPLGEVVPLIGGATFGAAPKATLEAPHPTSAPAEGDA